MVEAREVDDGAATPLWTPGPARIQATRLQAFRVWLRERRGLDLVDYEALRAWSVEDLRGFWSALWEFFGLDAVSGYDEVLEGSGVQDARWFSGARLNFADRVLSAGADGEAAVISTSENLEPRTRTWAELRREVSAFAATLSRWGVAPGDRVVGYLPNTAEAVVAFLATASVGAIWCSVGQDYAAPAVVERLGQLQPTVLVTADGYRYGGKDHDRVDAVRDVLAGLPTVRRTVVLNRLHDHVLVPGASSWDEAVAETNPLPVVAVPFAHPLWVLFSSGTTGRPKGIVHGHGGVLLEQLKSWGLQWDLGPTDRLLWFTSPSWVMWNLLVSGLATGATIVTYDGSPTHPGPDELWRQASLAKATVLGTSPAYLQLSKDAELRPAGQHDLSTLRALGSTGSPLPAALHRWAVEAAGNVPLISMSGGTDIAGAFCGGASTEPIWAGEMSVRHLGVAMEAWDDDGRPVEQSVGELVVTAPMPSMPLFLWGDSAGSRLRETYFSKYPDVWRHGDFVTITDRGSVLVHGRSDSMLNRNGVRIGTGDIYGAVEALPEVVESLVVGVEEPGGSYWMPLFVVLAEGHELNDDLKRRIVDMIRRETSPRHVPDEIIEVAALPHTRTGKKLEVPVKRLLQGASLERVVQLGAVDDASALMLFAEIGRRRSVTRLSPIRTGASVEGGSRPEQEVRHVRH